jgi:hypothetical protein
MAGNFIVYNPLFVEGFNAATQILPRRAKRKDFSLGLGQPRVTDRFGHRFYGLEHAPTTLDVPRHRRNAEERDLMSIGLAQLTDADRETGSNSVFELIDDAPPILQRLSCRDM